MSFSEDITFCLKPRCPVCRQGRLFKPFTVEAVEKCANCDAPLGRHDVGDGAAVFVLFLLCFSIIPMAWAVELLFAPPLWLQIVIWAAVGLGMVGVLLPSSKAYIIMLEWRHLKRDTED
jgi:uncharacterized protein (DUF983 family)